MLIETNNNTKEREKLHINIYECKHLYGSV